ncbi:hypothetical protein DESAMIL20_875 [Desulfurella amilsii]|uniref:Probable membrane transporter protein n=1 Tax=Desulfurella amilsii TaxID=1562698 RepID=A0A1X4XUW5_9BACT|nr:sulfite exporter TauE/SafE family protein [Desulfurella amilsii]OSS41322.1 hypothetical protein DESAMIL20_875 [Desulfurella amilsii]
MVELLNSIVLLFFSATVTAVGNIIGIGGGVILVPFFIFYLHLNPIIASGLSLFTIVISTASGSYAFLRQKVIDRNLLLFLLMFILPGVIIGSFINRFVNTQQFKNIFPLWIIVLGIISLKSTKKQSVNLGSSEPYRKAIKNTKTAGFVSLGAGFISGFFGVGVGGIIGTYLLGTEKMHPRVALSTLITTMTFTSLIGFLIHFFNSLPYLNAWLIYILPLAVGAVFGSQMGAYVAKIVKPKNLSLYRGWIILSLGFALVFINMLTLV